MTDQIKPDPATQPSPDDIQFLADRADARELQDKDKGEALMVLLSALSNSRFDQHHHRERAELLASIRR